MLSIARMERGQGKYYTNLAGADYYTGGGEPDGHWLGTGARALGLHGKVDAKVLHDLLEGFGPNGAPLVRNAGHEKRAVGWDLTFSPDKTVSLALAFADHDTRKEIERAAMTAIERTLTRFAEEELAFCRVGKGGHTRVSANLIAAVFPHATSRALDPQLHYHCLLPNVGVCEDGNTRALVSQHIYDNKMLMGVYFRVEFAAELKRRLGIDVERPVNRHGNPKSWWQLKGVPKELVEYFSQRRREIVQTLGAKGLESASAAAVACTETREVKAVVPPRGQLYRLWRQLARDRGFSLDWVDQVLQPVHGPEQNPVVEYRAALSAAVAKITAEHSYFTEATLVRYTLEESQGRGLSADFVRGWVSHDLKNDGQFVNLGVLEKTQHYTTQEIMGIEKELLDAAESLNWTLFKRASDKTVDRVLAKEWTAEAPSKKGLAGLLSGSAQQQSRQTYKLNDEQQAAVRHIVQDPGRIKLIDGLAGTGKTAMLRAAREILEGEGYRVVGCALAGVADKGLQEGSGIESDTVRMRLMQLYPKPWDLAKHHVRQLARAARKLKTGTFPTLEIDPKTVFVLDEAGMVGTRDFALLSKAIARGGGILVCLGDEKQIPSIDAGGCFRSLLNRFDNARLSEITRQQSEEQRENVKRLSRGEAEQFLRSSAKRGDLLVAKDRQAARERLIGDWAASGGVQSPQDHLILVTTNREADEYNLLAQRERMRAGQLHEGQQVTVDGTTFHQGDRLMFTRKSRRLGIENGDRGTIVAVRRTLLANQIAVRLDGDNRTVVITTSGRHAYKSIQLGYAFTTHKMQGATVDHTYVHLGGQMTNREMAYVQGSRHRNRLRLYTDENEAGVSLTKFVRDCEQGKKPCDGELKNSPLVSQMKKSEAPQLAHDVAEQARREESLTQQLER